MIQVNETHDPTLTSWVESANEPLGDFPIQNLPFGDFTDTESGRDKIGIAIGNMILDVTAARSEGVIGGAADDAAAA